MGICMPISLKEAIDNTRGDVPRSTYISKVLEQIYKKRTGKRNSECIGSDSAVSNLITKTGAKQDARDNK